MTTIKNPTPQEIKEEMKNFTNQINKAKLKKEENKHKLKLNNIKINLIQTEQKTKLKIKNEKTNKTKNIHKIESIQFLPSTKRIHIDKIDIIFKPPTKIRH
jgi:hypothetical protein